MVGTTYSAQPTKMVNKIAYALIAIFLGWIGIHRFYAGKAGSGIGYIILGLITFFTITGLLGLIEGIIALTKQADSNGNIPVYANSFFV